VSSMQLAPADLGSRNSKAAFSGSGVTSSRVCAHHSSNGRFGHSMVVSSTCSSSSLCTMIAEKPVLFRGAGSPGRGRCCRSPCNRCSQVLDTSVELLRLQLEDAGDPMPIVASSPLHRADDSRGPLPGGLDPSSLTSRSARARVSSCKRWSWAYAPRIRRSASRGRARASAAFSAIVAEGGEQLAQPRRRLRSGRPSDRALPAAAPA